MEWIKLYTGKWLYGSGRTMPAEKRGVWMDLLALAAETKFRDGTLRFDVGQPMPRDYIASILRLDRVVLDDSLTVFQTDINADDGKPRITVWDDGTIELTNFARYQAVPEDKKRLLDSRDIELVQRLQARKSARQYPDEAANVVQEELDKTVEARRATKVSERAARESDKIAKERKAASAK